MVWVRLRRAMCQVRDQARSLGHIYALFALNEMTTTLPSIPLARPSPGPGTLHITLLQKGIRALKPHRPGIIRFGESGATGVPKDASVPYLRQA